MSVRSLGTLAAVRDVKAPKKGDMGKGKARTDDTPPPDNAKTPTLLDLLVTLVPTELVAPYTLTVGVIVGLIDKPTTKNPKPDDFAEGRVLLFIALLVLTAAYIYIDKRSKESRKRLPLPEIIGGVVAAAAWGLVMPMSPLETILDGKQPAVAAAVIAFVALGINAVIAKALKRPAT